MTLDRRFRLLLPPVWVALCVLADASAARADLVRLHSGGELRGKIVKTGTPRQTPDIRIETLSGAVVAIPRADVAFLTQRPLVIEEYEVRARHAAHERDAQWALAQWCKEKGLTAQRQLHLQRVLELDDSFEPAHVALGHVWKEGAWVDHDQYMAARGYVKHKGKYVTPQQLELLEKTAEELQREQDWHPKIRLWTGWLTGRHEERAKQGLAALQNVQDADAAPAVLKFLGEHAAREVRLLGVEILTRSPGEKSAKALAKVTLLDVDVEVRHLALAGIPEDQFQTVQPLFIKELRHEQNARVCRAARALYRVGDDHAIAPLIDALITSHRYEVRVPGGSAPTYSFAANGGFAPQAGMLPPDIEAALRTGQLPQGVVLLNSPDPVQNQLTKTVAVRVDHQNPDALSALQKLTGQDFGYDERLWHLWWAAQKAEAGGLTKS